ncbi:MAG TPA: HlyD family efflux transporter periplasmic adaptor subunit [Pirellulales bacterium]
MSTEIAATLSSWQHLDDLVDEIAALAQSDVSSREFWSRLLDRTVRALAAVGGAIWLRRADGQFELECQHRLDAAPWIDPGEPRRRHAQLISHVAGSGLALSIPPHSAASGALARSGELDNASEFLLLLAPARAEQETLGVIEIFQRPAELPTAPEAYLRLMSAVAELAADFYQRRQLRELRDRSQSWRQYENFTQAAHSDLDLKRTAYTVANDGRALVGADRVSVAWQHGRGVRLIATSGVDAVDRRAASVKLLERLIQAVLAVGEPLSHPDASGLLPPQLEQALDAYLDESHARRVSIIPLRQPLTAEETRAVVEIGGDAKTLVDFDRPTIGALVIEDFNAPAADDPREELIAAVTAHATIALANAASFQSVPLARMWRTLGMARGLTRGRQLFKTLLVVGTLAAAVAALVFFPMDFTVEGRGELLPERRRDIFAPTDGVIEKILVEHGDQVTAGQTLLILRRPQLDFEMTRVLGEMQTARKRLDGLAATRLGGTAAATENREQFHQRTAEEEEVKELLKSLEKQLALLKQQAEELTIRSPIDGQVLTWDVSQLLESRPVERGRALLRVDDLNGPWELKLRVPDEDIGFVLEQRQGNDESLDVSFMLATDPDQTHTAKVRDVAMNTDTVDEHGPQVTMTATLDRNEIPRLRPGADVIANVHCGRRSLGFVLFHDIWNAIQTRLLF